MVEAVEVKGFIEESKHSKSHKYSRNLKTVKMVEPVKVIKRVTIAYVCMYV